MQAALTGFLKRVTSATPAPATSLRAMRLRTKRAPSCATMGLRMRRHARDVQARVPYRCHRPGDRLGVVAEYPFDAAIGATHEPVNRHGHFQDQLAHYDLQHQLKRLPRRVVACHLSKFARALRGFVCCRD
jgi:hypothetical protein